MPGESISGYINVKTFKPSEIEGFSTMVEVGRGEQDLGGGDIERTNARVSYSDDIFGILVYASKNLREQITQNRETEYGVAGPGLLTPDKIDFRNYLLEREDEAVGATIERYLDNGGRIFYTHLDTQFDDYEDRNHFRFYLGARAAKTGRTLTPTKGTAPDTYVRRLLEFGEYHNETTMHTIGADLTFGEWDVIATASQIETMFDTYLPLPYYLRGIATNVNYDISNPEKPILTFDEKLSEINYPVAVNYVAQAALQTDTDQFKVDMVRFNDLGELKVGFKYDSRDGEGGGLGLWVGSGRGTFNLAGALAAYDYPDRLFIEDDLNNSVGAYYVNNRQMRADMEAQGSGRVPFPTDQRISIEETILSAYVLQTIDKDWGNIVVGVRVEDTEYDTIGSKLVGTVLQPLQVSQSYTNFLPTAHINYNLDEDKKLRLSFSTGISRPTYHESRAGASINDVTEQITGGNPFLDEEKAWGIDAAYEWYFDEARLLAISLYTREIDNVIYTTNTKVLGSVYSDAAAEGDLWDLEAYGNGSDGKLQGFELAFTGRLENYVEGFLSGFGFTGNITSIDSEFKAPAGFILPALPGQSDLAYNASIFYENEDLSIRVNYMYRDEWLDETEEGPEDMDNILWDEQVRVDASIRYDLERLTGVTASVYLNLNNMTNETDVRFTGQKWNPNQIESYGKRYLAGIRINF